MGHGHVWKHPPMKLKAPYASMVTIGCPVFTIS